MMNLAIKKRRIFRQEKNPKFFLKKKTKKIEIFFVKKLSPWNENRWCCKKCRKIGAEKIGFRHWREKNQRWVVRVRQLSSKKRTCSALRRTRGIFTWFADESELDRMKARNAVNVLAELRKTRGRLMLSLTRKDLYTYDTVESSLSTYNTKTKIAKASWNFFFLFFP